MNNTEPVLITPTAEACQAACAKHQQCAAFQWIGVGDNESATTRHHQCLFKCAGAVTPGRTQCSLGHAMGTAGGSFICGPKRNNSNAPAPPGPPPPAKPTGPPCPVPFGLTGAQIQRHKMIRMTLFAPLFGMYLHCFERINVCWGVQVELWRPVPTTLARETQAPLATIWSASRGACST